MKYKIAVWKNFCILSSSQKNFLPYNFIFLHSEFNFPKSFFFHHYLSKDNQAILDQGFVVKRLRNRKRGKVISSIPSWQKLEWNWWKFMLPKVNSEIERGFSCLKRTNPDLRNKLIFKRLQNLRMISLNKEGVKLWTLDENYNNWNSIKKLPSLNKIDFQTEYACFQIQKKIRKKQFWFRKIEKKSFCTFFFKRHFWNVFSKNKDSLVKFLSKFEL